MQDLANLQFNYTIKLHIWVNINAISHTPSHFTPFSAILQYSAITDLRL